MTNVTEIQAAIQLLPQGEFARLRKWFSEKDWENWDAELGADSASNNLDFLYEEARDAKNDNTRWRDI